MRYFTVVRGRRHHKACKRGSHGPRWYRPRLEFLEDRTLLSAISNPSQLAADLSRDAAGLQASLNNTLGRFQDAIPLVGKGLTAFNNLAEYLTQAAGKLGGASDTAAYPIPLDTGIGTLTLNAVPQGADVQFTVSLDSATHSVATQFDLGLGSFLTVTPGSRFNAGVGFTLDFNYHNLTGGIDLSGFALTLSAGLNNSFSATAALNGVLAAHVSNAGTSQVSGTIAFTVNGTTISAPRFTGSADADLHLALGFDPGIHAPFDPHLSADFHMHHWGFTNADLAQAGAGSSFYKQFGSAELYFDNVNLDVDNIVPGFLEPVVHAVQRFTEPLQPYVNLLNQEVPIVSAFGVHVSFLDLLKQNTTFGGGLSDALDAISFINQIGSADAPHGVSIPILAPGQRFSLTPAGGAGAGFNVGKALDQIRSVFGELPPDLADLVQNTLGPVFDQFQSEQDYGLKFPFLQDPQSSVLQLLIGQPVNLFTYTMPPLEASASATLSADLGILGVGLTGSVDVSAGLSVGYDTTGLTKAVADLGTPSKIPGDLLAGFFIDATKTKATLKASLGAFASAGVSVKGGVDANVELKFDPKLGSQVRLSQLVDDFDCLFRLTGSVTAHADISLTISAFIGSVTLFSYELASATIAHFDLGCTDPGKSSAEAKYPQQIMLELENGAQEIDVVPYTKVSRSYTRNRDTGLTELRPQYEYGIEVNYVTGALPHKEFYPTGTALGEADPTSNTLYGIITDLPGGLATLQMRGDHRIIIDRTQLDFINDPRPDDFDVKPEPLDKTSWDGVNAVLVGGLGNDTITSNLDSGNVPRQGGTVVIMGGGGNDDLEGGTVIAAGYEPIIPLNTQDLALFDPKVVDRLRTSITLLSALKTPGNALLVAPDSAYATLEGGAGNNVFRVGHNGLGAVCFGGTGNNWYDVASDSGNVIINGAGKNNTLHYVDEPASALDLNHDTGTHAVRLFLDSARQVNLTDTATEIDSGTTLLQTTVAQQLTAVEISHTGTWNAADDIDDSGLLPLSGLAVHFNPGAAANSLHFHAPSFATSHYVLAPRDPATNLGEDLLTLTTDPIASVFPGTSLMLFVRGLHAADTLTIDGGLPADYRVAPDPLQPFVTDLEGPITSLQVDGTAYHRSVAFFKRFGQVVPHVVPPDTVGVTDEVVTLWTYALDSHGQLVRLGAEVKFHNASAALEVDGQDKGALITVLRLHPNGTTTINGGARGASTINAYGDGMPMTLASGSDSSTIAATGSADFTVYGGQKNVVTLSATSSPQDLVVFVPRSASQTTLNLPAVGAGYKKTVSFDGLITDRATTLVVNDAPGDEFMDGTYTIGRRHIDIDHASERDGGPEGTVSFDYYGVSTLVLNPSAAPDSGQDFVDINAVPCPLTVNTQAGANRVSVAAATHNLDDILSEVTVNGGSAAQTAVVINDQSNSYRFTDSNFYLLQGNVIARVNRPGSTGNIISAGGAVAAGSNVLASVVGNGVQSFEVHAGARRNRFLIGSPQAAWTYLDDIDTNGHADSVEINGLAARLELNVGNKNNTMTLAGHVTLTAAQLAAALSNVGDQQTLLDNDTAAPVKGTFAEGTQFVRGAMYSINYTAPAEPGDIGGAAAQPDIVLSHANSSPRLALTVPAIAHEGDLVFASGTVNDLDALDSHTVAIDWGDGQSSTLDLQAGYMSFSASHRYEERSTPYTVTATATDSHAAQDQRSAAVRIYDAPLVLANDAPVLTEGPNNNVVLATFTDAGGDGTVDGYKARIDWGDGSPGAPDVTDGTVVALDATTYQVVGSHAYQGDADAGALAYAVSVQVSDGAARTAGPVLWQYAYDVSPLVERQGAVAVRGSDGAIYIVGGTDGKTPLATFERFDPVTLGYKRLADLPIALTGLTMAAGSDGSIYVFGGATGTQTSAKAYRYDPAASRWSTLPDLPQATGYAAAVTGRDGLIYVIGGEQLSRAVGGKLTARILNKVQVFDPEPPRGRSPWSTRLPLPTPRSHLAAVLGPDGNLYAIGGQNSTDPTRPGTPLATVELFNTKQTAWSAGPSLSVGRADLAAAVGGPGLIYALGGDVPRNDQGVPVYSVEALDPETYRWAAQSNLDLFRSHFAAAAGSDGRIYTFGGLLQRGALKNEDNSVLALGPALVTLSEAPLSAGQAFTVSATAGTSFTATLATFTDPANDGTVGDYTGIIQWAPGSTTAAQFQFNGDGSVAVSGTFTYAQAGSYPVSVLVQDANATVTLSATVQVAPPAGAPPQFAAATRTFFTGNGVLALGDFNGDHKLDVFCGGGDTSPFDVLLGDGTGHYTAGPGTPPSPDGATQSVAIAQDLNGDNHADVIVANDLADTSSDTDRKLTLLLGDGTGQLSPAPNSPILVGTQTRTSGDGLVALAVADVNGDTKPDVIVVDRSRGEVHILLQDDSGGFSEAPGSPLSMNADAVACADFNGDRVPDLAVATGSGTSTAVAILLGDGTGRFTAAPGSPYSCNFGFGFPPVRLLSADLRGNGIQDLILLANIHDSNGVRVFLGNGDGTFAAPTAINGSFIGVEVADLNGDGHADLVLTTSSLIYLVVGDGTGQYALTDHTPALGTGFIYYQCELALGDVNGDGLPDIVMAGTGPGGQDMVETWLNTSG
jgi:hypothetical protein